MASDPMSCDRCGQPHVTSQGNPSCLGHRNKVTPLTPCGNDPMHYQTKCTKHGGKTPGALAAADRRRIEAKADALLARMLVNHDAEPVTDPYSALARSAGMLRDAVDEVGRRVNELNEIRFTDAKGSEQMRTEVALWVTLLDRSSRLQLDMSKLDLVGKIAQRQHDRAVFLATDVLQPYSEALVVALGHDPEDPTVRDAIVAALVTMEGRAA
jgi:hypothetical protein